MTTDQKSELQNCIEGLQILVQYDRDGHGQINGYADSVHVTLPGGPSAEDQTKLQRLGWRLDYPGDSALRWQFG